MKIDLNLTYAEIEFLGRVVERRLHGGSEGNVRMAVTTAVHMLKVGEATEEWLRTPCPWVAERSRQKSK